MADADGARADTEQKTTAFNRQFWIMAALIVLALFAAYWFFIRQSFVPVLSGVEPQDAAEVVKVLEAKKIPYELADEGRTVLVASAQADKARIELVGSELPMHGQVGFELFNQSDMGLTEFAQKINYQRALQGELARTILLLDGIQSVRVHLGLPEQRLFRDEQVHPKASVTLILKPGAALTTSRVEGVQRMVSGAVPDLTPDAVAVLDGSGKVVSSSDIAPPAPASTSDAVIQSYRQRVTAALQAHRPGLESDVSISLRYLDRSAAVPIAQVGDNAGNSDTAVSQSPTAVVPRGDPDFAMAIRVSTRDPLDDASRSDLTQAIERATDFNAAKGDTLAFVAGWVPLPTQVQAAVQTDKVVSKRETPQSDGDAIPWLSYWPIAAALGLIALAIAFISDRRRARQRREDNLTSFAQQLQDRLAAAELVSP